MRAASVAEGRRVLQALALVKKVRKRIVAVLMLQSRRPVRPKSRPTRPSAAAAAALLSRHVLIETGGGFACEKCFRCCPVSPSASLAWLRSSCPAVCGGGFDPSHTLSAFRELHFCTTCGAYGSGRPRLLLRPCSRPTSSSAKPHWQYDLDRIAVGVLPRGLAQWPGQCELVPRRRAASADVVVAANSTEKKARRRYCLSTSPSRRLSMGAWLSVHRAAAGDP